MNLSDDSRSAADGRLLTLCVPATPPALSRVRRTVCEWLRTIDVDPATAYDLVFGVNEACSNAIEHPVDAGRPFVEVEGRYDGSAVVLAVRDSGSWRGSTAAIDRGRGLQLMRALADEVHLRTSPSGTEVQLRRRLARA